ncbi:MAG: radical SAM protein [Gemmatimonadota bacterium]|nr:MAG: radical SAM protein [Gemmatimonadota bacterium]
MSTMQTPPREVSSSQNSNNSRIPASHLSRVLFRTPDVFWRLLRAEATKRFFAPRDRARLDGTSDQLTQVSLKIVNSCNLRCKTCGQWGETGYNHDKPASELREIVPVETYRAMVDQLAHRKPFYYIWGGEPYLYRDLMPLMEHMKQRNGLVGVVTNGTMMEKTADRLVAAGVDMLMLSVDGVGPVHNEIRGEKNAWERMMNGLDAVIAEKKRQGAKKPYINVLATISRDNVGHLEDIADWGADRGIDLLTYYYSWFTNEETGQAHEAVMKERFDTTPEAWKGYLFFTGLDSDGLRAEVKSIQSRKWPFPVMFIPDLKDDQIVPYYDDPTTLFGYGNCIQPWLVTEILPNGDVATCRDYPDYVCGNIQKDDLLTIWNNDKYRKFRTSIHEDGLLPICSRCCGLMGW